MGSKKMASGSVLTIIWWDILGWLLEPFYVCGISLNRLRTDSGCTIVLDKIVIVCR